MNIEEMQSQEELPWWGNHIFFLDIVFLVIILAANKVILAANKVTAKPMEREIIQEIEMLKVLQSMIIWTIIKLVIKRI